MDRRERAVIALAHRVEHRHDLVAQHLTDDDARRVHSKRTTDELGHRHSAKALGVGQPLLERDDVRVQVLELAEAKLESTLNGDEPFPRRDLVGERAQHGGFSGVGRTGDHDVLARRYGSLQE